MPIRAFVLIITKPGTSQEIVRSRKIQGVKIAASVFGSYDAVLVIDAENLEELTKTVYEVIEQQPNVVRTETLISILETPSKL